MVSVSDEYCGGCGDGRPVCEEPFPGGVNYVCCECGRVVYTEFDEPEDGEDE